jgi:protein ImuA
LKLAGLHEVIAASAGSFSGFPGISGASSSFAAWLLKKCLSQRTGMALWCRRPAGRFDPQPYGPGLTRFIDPTRLLVVEARDQSDLLWAMEEGLRCKGIAAVLGETGSADLTATRRLLLAAESNASTAILLRPPTATTSSAALTRWQITSAPARSTQGLRDIAAPRWRVELLRARGITTQTQSSWLMEWNDETGDLALASSSLDRSAGAPRPAMARATGGDGGFGFRRAAARVG